MPVSLFYHYADIADVESVAARLRNIGPELNLAGRIRVSTEGINGTFGGTTRAVASFHQALLLDLQHPNIDFKISEGSAENFPEGWVVRVCRELVTMGVPPEEASWRDAAPHLDSADFKRELRDELEKQTNDVVVLDVRNRYEHAIGRFKGAVLPPIRQFSDFPGFVKDNMDMFRDKRVLMYCTGGIRCERASAFLKHVGIASSVAQLRGGIDRFLKRYPCGGGVFQGKNLVFDTRMALGTSQPTTVGECLNCGCLWDDYSKGWRCVRCRSRLLLCEKQGCTDSFYIRNEGLCATCQVD